MLFRKPGEVAGTRRCISEIIKWRNYVTDNRFITLAADLFGFSLTSSMGRCGGTTIRGPIRWRNAGVKAAIQEAGNGSTAIGIVSQSTSVDPAKFQGCGR